RCDRVHAFRRAGARGGRQSAHGPRARHRRRPHVRGHLCARQRPRRARRRARDRDRRPRSCLRLHLSRLCVDRSSGRRPRLDRRLFSRGKPARRHRHGRQVLFSRARRLSHLSRHGHAADVAAGRPVRETLMTPSAIAEPQRQLEAQVRWRPLEVAFWLATLAPFVLAPGSLVLASQIAITALFALSLDLILGYAGIVSLGHAAYFGFGSYTAGLVAKWGWGEPLSGLAIAAAAAGLLGYLTSIVIARFRHLALIMITLGFGLLLAEAANSASWLTGGADGLQGVRMGKLLGIFQFDLYGTAAYGYSLAVLFVSFLVARRLINSPFGLALRGIRENAMRMPAIGARSPAHIRK